MTTKNATKVYSPDVCKPNLKAKYPAKPVKVTRKNMLKFADLIFNPKTKRYLPLCSGTLENGPDESGREMSCALGDMYYFFVSKKPIKTVDKNGDPVMSVTDYDVVCRMFNRSSPHDPFGDELVYALEKVPSINDKGAKTGHASFTRRAQRVRKYILEKIVPLLK